MVNITQKLTNKINLFFPTVNPNLMPEDRKFLFLIYFFVRGRLHWCKKNGVRVFRSDVMKHHCIWPHVQICKMILISSEYLVYSIYTIIYFYCTQIWGNELNSFLTKIIIIVTPKCYKKKSFGKLWDIVFLIFPILFNIANSGKTNYYFRYMLY